MKRTQIIPTGREQTFGREEIIVSKTDLKGIITYGNDVFLRVAGYTEEEILGAPHSILRHPDMPRVVFALLWETIQSGKEIFAYVKNLARNGDYYWVLAHVTPTFSDGRIVGYHSMRRWPDPRIVSKFEPIYAELLAIEQRAPDKRSGIEQARSALVAKLGALGTTWDALMFSEI
jgi:PAS domain S-box-containing protein